MADLKKTFFYGILCNIHMVLTDDMSMNMDNRMAWQWAETLVEIRETLVDIRGTTK